MNEGMESQFEDDQSTAANGQLCQVCGDSSDSQHFGASACRACAAFFRRTVSHRLRYVCRFEDNCEFAKSGRSTCKSCRWAKCLKAGMEQNAVRSRPGAESKPGKCLKVAHPSAAAIAPTNERQPKGENLQKQRDKDNLPIGKEFPEKTAAAESGQQSGVLENIIRLKESISVLDVKQCRQLPADYPMLAKILLGYSRLEKARDDKYNRLSEANGTKIRMFVEKSVFDLYTYWKNVHNELEWVAELLLFFGPYQQLPLADKLCLFRNFWILFMILERNYDTANVLGSSREQNRRMLFTNGEIIDMDICEYDHSRIEGPQQQAGGTQQQQKSRNKAACQLKPWFKRSVDELLPFVRQLSPRPPEMAFCFGLMFWRLQAEVSQKLSPGAAAICQEAVDCLYRELDAFYAKEMPQENVVRRVAELCRLLSITEILALQRKEEIILARTFETFQAFKVDIYMEQVFGRA